ncbi:hypothetical protein B0H11DRAFT_2117127 [Mycena galericulata]|nr:hypothetical protein B0H11DRAFT_2117127 [Mycena galericulata]
MAASQTTSQSERFCAPDADITVSSSDNVLFKLHRKNLEVHSDIFANAADATRPENGNDSEVVHLSENCDVLDLLFQYMYRQPQPDLQKVEFDVCLRLAEAAEKYIVHSAIPAVKLRLGLQDFIGGHPLEVLDYAGRHNHNDLAQNAARISMGRSVTEAVLTLAPDNLLKWVRLEVAPWLVFAHPHMRLVSMTNGTRNHAHL